MTDPRMEKLPRASMTAEVETYRGRPTGAPLNPSASLRTRHFRQGQGYLLLSTIAPPLLKIHTPA